MPVHRRFVPVALAGVATATLAAVAGNQDWATLDSGAGRATEAAFASAGSAAADASAPPVVALALVLLATWGVVLVSRGWARRAVTVLGLLAAVGVVGFAVSAWLHAPGDLVSIATVDGSSQAASRTWWSWVGVVAGLATVATSVLATISVSGWPEMGRRYDAPGAVGGTRPPDPAPEEQTNLELWRAIDEGRDPTEGRTH